MTESAKPQQTQPAVPATNTPPRKRGVAWPVLIALVILVAAGTGGYIFGWPYVSEQWHRFTDLERQLQEVTARIEQRSDVAAAASAASEARTRSLLDAARREGEQTLRQFREEIDAELADTGSQSALRMGRLELQVDRLLAVDRRAWLGHEAAFLLRLASQRLLVARDIDAATSLLVQADELLRATDAPAYEPVRLAIAQDHAHLMALPKVDEVGLYGRLTGLIDQVEQLRLAYEGAPVIVEEVTVGNRESGNQNWLDGVESSWHQAIRKLSDYLLIRRSNEEVAALMTPEWAALARQNLRMLLEQCQIAMLTANASLYQQSLARSERFIRLFSGHDPDRVQVILKEIQALQSSDIAPDLPDMVQTRSLLDAELKRLDSQMAP